MELSQREINRLRSVTRDNIQVKPKGQWEDDHLPCAGAVINGVSIGFWYLEHWAADAFRYADSQKALDVIFGLVADAVKTYDEESAHD